MVKSTMTRRARYDWRPWLERDTEHVATQGRDFDCSPASFVSVLHRRADREGLIVNTTTEDRSVRFTFTKPRRRAAR